MERWVSLLGVGVFVAIAYGLSLKRSAIRWRPVLWGMALQLFLAVFILRTPLGFEIFQGLGTGVSRFLDFADVGAQFVFGEDFKKSFVAFKILPTIVFFSAVINLLYHYGVLQWLVGGMARVMVKTLGTSGAESLSATANIFVGQTEAPLLVKPYLATMTESELFAVMTGGFATIAGGVMAAYIGFGIPAPHLLAASVMSAPAGLAIAKVMVPETEEPQTRGRVQIVVERTSTNAIDAVTTGTLDGLRLALNVGAMLISFLGLVAALNALLGWMGGLVGLPSLSLEQILGYGLAPLAWLMGVPWADCGAVGVLLGKRTILNEFIAYLDLKAMLPTAAVATGNITGPVVPQISERAGAIATYALCGFANLGAVGVTIGGLSGMAPNRQGDLARLGLRAMIGGNLACFMTAAIAGLLL